MRNDRPLMDSNTDEIVERQCFTVVCTPDRFVDGRQVSVNLGLSQIEELRFRICVYLRPSAAPNFPRCRSKRIVAGP